VARATPAADLRLPAAAAQTRVVCLAGIRLDSGKSVRSFKGIICHDISEFESSHASHAVGLSCKVCVSQRAHNSTFNKLEATPVQTHGQVAARLTLSDRFYTPTPIRPDNEDAHPPG